VKPEVRKEYARSRGLIIKFGVTAREYDAILEYQGGGCFICGEPPKKTRLAVEHRHKDGLLRALVCWGCNKAIAYLRDNSDRAARALEMLMYPPASTALKREVFGRTGRVSRRWRTKREKAERMAALADLLKADKAYYEGGAERGKESARQAAGA